MKSNPVITIRAYGKISFTYADNTQTFVGYLYTGTAQYQLTQKQAVSTIYTQAKNCINWTKMVAMYDQCRVLSFSISIRHAGILTQTQNESDGVIPTPVAVAIYQTTPSTSNTFFDTIGTKPSCWVTQKDKTLGWSIPKPNVYVDLDNSNSFPTSWWVVTTPAAQYSSSAEYYVQYSFNVQFTKKEIKLEAVPNMD